MVINQCAHATRHLTDHKHIAHAQRAALDKHRRHRPTPLVELGLNNDALAVALGIGLEFHHLRLQGNRLKQVFQTGTGLRRNLNHLSITAHIFGDNFMLQ